MKRYQYVDPRPVGFGESSDCTVRALSNITGWDYQKCHDLAESAGRKKYFPFVMEKLLRKAFPSWSEEQLNGEVPSVLGKTNYDYPTVNQFITSHQIGGFIVRVQGHVFALKDGVVLDHNQFHPRSRVRRFWKINV